MLKGSDSHETGRARHLPPRRIVTGIRVSPLVADLPGGACRPHQPTRILRVDLFQQILPRRRPSSAALPFSDDWTTVATAPLTAMCAAVSAVGIGAKMAKLSLW